MAGYTTLTIADAPAHRDPDTGSDWIPLRNALGVQAFGINGWRAPRAGAQLIDDHDEADCGHEEVYVVLAGAARFHVAGDEFDAPAGTIVFVSDPALQRVAHALQDGTLLLTVGAAPGVAFEVSDWERRWLAEA